LGVGVRVGVRVSVRVHVGHAGQLLLLLLDGVGVLAWLGFG
jgi:hypothetical protein